VPVILIVDNDPAVAFILEVLPAAWIVTFAPAFIVNAPENVTTGAPPGAINKFPLIVQLSSKVTVGFVATAILAIPNAFGHVRPLLLRLVVPLALVDIELIPAIPIVEERVTAWPGFAALVDPTVMALVMVIVLV
jgi:hypothetical protein